MLFQMNVIDKIGADSSNSTEVSFQIVVLTFTWKFNVFIQKFFNTTYLVRRIYLKRYSLLQDWIPAQKIR